MERQGNLSTVFPFPNKIWGITTMTNTGIVIYRSDLIYPFLTSFAILNWPQDIWFQLSSSSEICLFFYKSFWFGCFLRYVADVLTSRCGAFWYRLLYMICVALSRPFSVSLGGITTSDKEMSLLMYSFCWSKGQNQIMKCLS